MNWIANYIDHPLLLILASVIAIPLIWPVWKAFFGDVDGLAEDLKDAALPDIYAFFTGRYNESRWAELKIGAFLIVVFGVVAAMYKICTLVFY